MALVTVVKFKGVEIQDQFCIYKSASWRFGTGLNGISNFEVLQFSHVLNFAILAVC